jgi:hypothetical protein
LMAGSRNRPSTVSELVSWGTLRIYGTNPSERCT